MYKKIQQHLPLQKTPIVKLPGATARASEGDSEGRGKEGDLLKSQ
jgi:hypothetical protein